MKLTPVKKISKSLGTRYVKYGGFAAIVTIAVIVAVIFLNLIIQVVSPQFDLTGEKLFSLSEQTLQVLEAVKGPVTIYGIWEPGRENVQAQEIAELYAARSRFVTFKALDPDLNPGLLQRFNQDDRGIDKRSLVVEGEKGFKIISEMNMYDYYLDQQQQPRFTGLSIERRITSALIFVSTGETPVIYEISGHEEVPLYMRQMRETVEQENYALKDLDLMTSPIPADASALILNNPLRELSPPEREKILEYLEGGGRLLVLMDYRSGAVEGVNEILASYGIRFDHGVLLEQDQNYALRSPFILVPNMADHDILRPLTEKRTAVVSGFPQGVSILNLRRRTVNAVSLLTSSPNSFLRTDLSDPAAPNRLPGDLSGPHTLAAAVMDPEYSQDGKQTRIVAMGAAVLDPLTLDPLSMRPQQIPGNLDFFLNSLTWLEDRPETLSVRSRSLFQMNLMISPLQLIIFSLAFVVLIPLAFFILALVTWLRRRHL
jgi:hypothetical protein